MLRGRVDYNTGAVEFQNPLEKEGEEEASGYDKCIVRADPSKPYV
jgi:hypothetical protein